MGRFFGFLCLSLCFSASADSFQLYGQRGTPLSPCNTSHSSSSSSNIVSLSPIAAAAGVAATAAGAAAGGPVDVALVKKLRQLTAAGYGSCVVALQQSSGDLQKAVQWLRRQGAADAAAAAAAAIASGSNTGGSEAAQQEGLIALSRLEPASRGAGGASAAGGPAAASAGPKGIERVVAVQVACSSDFVSRSDVFISAAKRVAGAACQSQGFAAAAKAAAAAATAGDAGSEREAATHQQQLLQRLLALPAQCCPPAEASDSVGGTPEAATIGEDLGYVSRLVGEQVTLKRVALREAQRGSGIVAFYCHQPLSADVGPMAVLLHLSYSRQQQQQQHGKEEEKEFEDRLRQLGKQLCMHIAATKPLAVRVEDLPPALVAQEQLFALDSLKDSNSNSKKCNNKNSNKSNNNSNSQGMPEALKQKIVEGKMSKWHKETVLLKQPWALDDSGRSTEKVLKETEKALHATIRVEGFDLLEATQRG